MWAFLIFVGGAFGFGALLLIVILLNPDKAQTWASWVLKACVYVNQRLEYAYISTNVSGRVNAYLKKDIFGGIEGVLGSRVVVRWHTDPQSVVSHKRGTLIVRMKPHDEQEVNVLHTILAVTPRMIAPEIRTRLNQPDSWGIDLQLCRRYAESASRLTVAAYRDHVLEPALSRDPELEPILNIFRVVDEGGLFIPVFVQELVELSRMYAVDPAPGIDREIGEFYRFLQTIAEREPGSEVPLTFVGQYVKVQIILVAKPTTRAFGVMPYRSRMSVGLAKGVESVYLLATGENIGFADRVSDEFQTDGRLRFEGRNKMVLWRAGKKARGAAYRFQRDRGYSIEEVMRKLQEDAGLEVGKVVECSVSAVDKRIVTVEVGEISGYIRRRDWSWGLVQDCADVVNVGETVKAEIISVSRYAPEVWLSRKRCLENPLVKIDSGQAEGKTLEMQVEHVISAEEGIEIHGCTDEMEGVPLCLPGNEWAWGISPRVVEAPEVGSVIAVVVVAEDREEGRLIVSRKRRITERWDDLREQYPRGKKLVTPVIRVQANGVWCEIEPGFVGFVPEEEFRRAGLELARFTETVSVGSQLYVYVRKVTGGNKGRATLGLQRNL